MLKSTHNAGFFSCCSVKLGDIVCFINSNQKLPDSVDSSQQFEWYKNDTNRDRDITFDYFEHYNNIDVPIIDHPINYCQTYQFVHYDLDYERITPLITKYFSPSIEVNEIINHIEKNTVYFMIIFVYYFIEEMIKLPKSKSVVTMNI